MCGEDVLIFCIVAANRPEREQGMSRRSNVVTSRRNRTPYNNPSTKLTPTHRATRSALRFPCFSNAKAVDYAAFHVARRREHPGEP